jgi:hypothetical protein
MHTPDRHLGPFLKRLLAGWIDTNRVATLAALMRVILPWMYLGHVGQAVADQHLWRVHDYLFGRFPWNSHLITSQYS